MSRAEHCRKCGETNWYAVPSGPQAGKRHCRTCHRRRQSAAYQRAYKARRRQDPVWRAKELQRYRDYQFRRRDDPARKEYEREYKKRPETRARANELCKARRARMTAAERQALSERKKRYYRDNREQFRIDARTRHYGLTLDQFHAMYEAQGELCAICREWLQEPHVDHDHDTKVVRGLLCGPCNSALGFFHDNLSIVRAATDYLERAKKRTLKAVA